MRKGTTASRTMRSTMAAARFAGASPDLAELARALDCDVVLFGTVLPAGQRCRVAAQLVEAPGGEVLWSQTSEASGSDVFEIQDMLVKRIVESLQLPLSGRERNALGSDVPANPIAYEFFLRANRSGMIGNQVVLARELYRRSVEADPNYAPAWVRLARCHRVIGKYELGADADAEFALCRQALDRALRLHPDMPSAHVMAALFALDIGRADEALDRLLQVVGRNPNEPQGWSGLVAAFRYAGMPEESCGAYARAHALEPGIVTSYFHTLDSLGRYEEALSLPSTSFEFDQIRVLAIQDREHAALQLAATLRAREQGSTLEAWVEVMEAAVQRDAEKARRVGPRLEYFPDPEGQTVVARCRIRAGDVEGGLAMFGKAVRQGYSNVPLFRHDPWFDPVRDRPEFAELLALAEERQRAWIDRYRGRIPNLVKPAPAGAA
jgi:tetratricopeptide (TPR) repeat protein